MSQLHRTQPSRLGHRHPSGSTEVGHLNQTPIHPELQHCAPLPAPRSSRAPKKKPSPSGPTSRPQRSHLGITSRGLVSPPTATAAAAASLPTAGQRKRRPTQSGPPPQLNGCALQHRATPRATAVAAARRRSRHRAGRLRGRNPHASGITTKRPYLTTHRDSRRSIALRTAGHRERRPTEVDRLLNRTPAHPALQHRARLREPPSLPAPKEEVVTGRADFAAATLTPRASPPASPHRHPTTATSLSRPQRIEKGGPPKWTASSTGSLTRPASPPRAAWVLRPRFRS